VSGFRSVRGTSRLLKHHVWGRPVVGAAVSGAGVRFPGSGWTVSGAATTVSGEGAVPLSAESRHPATEFLDVTKKFVVCWLAHVRERGRGNSPDDAVGAVRSAVQLEIRMAGNSRLYFRGKTAGPDGSQEAVRQVRYDRPSPRA
jgi:hypothetical protein